MNVYLKIKGCVDLSKTMKGISSFILTHPRAVIEMNISQLASATFVSPATIVRYAHHFGYNGFKEFKLALAANLDEYQTLEAIQSQEILACSPFLDVAKVKEYYYNASVTALKKEAKHIDDKTIEQLVEMILKVDVINIWGVGSSLLAAKDFTYRLRKVGIQAHTETMIGYDDTAFKIASGTEMNIIISQSLENTQVLQWMHNFLSNNRPFSIITTNAQSPFLKDASIAIIYGDYDMNLQMNDPFMNRVALYLVLDTIVGLIYTRQYGQSIKSLTDYKIAIKKEQERFYDFNKNK